MIIIIQLILMRSQGNYSTKKKGKMRSVPLLRPKKQSNYYLIWANQKTKSKNRSKMTIISTLNNRKIPIKLLKICKMLLKQSLFSEKYAFSQVLSNLTFIWWVFYLWLEPLSHIFADIWRMGIHFTDLIGTVGFTLALNSCST